MAETNHDGCEQECGCWEEGFADALAGMHEWSITVHDGICRCEFCVTGIALIEAALGDMAGILREIRGELKPAERSDELTVPGPAGGDPRPPAVFINSGAGVGHQAGKEPLGRRAESPEQLPGHRMHYQIQGLFHQRPTCFFTSPAGLIDTGPKAQNGVGSKVTYVMAKSWLFSLTTRGYAPPLKGA